MTIYIAPVKRWWRCVVGHAWSRPWPWLTGQTRTCLTCGLMDYVYAIYHGSNFR